MDNGVYITLSKQLALFRDMAVTANNIANTNTTGYSASHVLFTSYLDKDVSQRKPNEMAFTHDISTYRKLENGPVTSTGNSLDVAIQGDGYFSVETPLGVRYTRAGNLQLDGGGVLVTPEGYPVLDTSNQRITFAEDANTIDIGEIGNIKVNGEDFATIGIVRFENPQLLERVGDRLYSSEIAPQAVEEGVRVVQGAVEGSNVQPVIEMTRLIELSRSVASTAKFIEVMYDLQRKAASTWAQQA